MGDLSPHFSRAEFRCRGCTPERPCARFPFDTVDAQLLGILEAVRVHFGQPVTVTSGNRCPAHNARVGGASRSKHLTGRAADIQVRGYSSAEVAAWIDAELNAGGLAAYPNFTHVDTRTNGRWRK